MVLFSYDSLTFFAKFVDEIWIAGRIIAAAMLLISIIVTFAKKNYSKGFVKFLRYLFRLILSVAVAVGIFFGFSALKNRHLNINESYEKYEEMYKDGKVKTVSGKIADFTPATHSKAFTVDGVRFTIYSDKSYRDHRDSSEEGPALYYTYVEAYTYTSTTTTTNGGIVTNSHYVPENCVILGENQLVEIEYVEEFGQNRILVIKELSE